jgi:hypothetical protein
MTTTDPSHRHGPQVAHPHLEVIPEGDALPSTHTNHTTRPDRKATHNVAERRPFPVTASNLPAVSIAVTMRLAVPAAAALSVFQVLGGHPARWVGVAVAVGVPVLVGLVGALRVVTTRPASRPCRRSPGGRRV